LDNGGEDKAVIRTRKINRGNGAAHILEHPVFLEAIETLRKQNYEQYCSTLDEAEAIRRGLWAKKIAIDAIALQLEAFVQNGHFYAAEVKAERLDKNPEKE